MNIFDMPYTGRDKCCVIVISTKITKFALSKSKRIMKDYIMPLLQMMGEMAPYLLLGFLLAGVLHAFVPRRVYSTWLSGNGFRSVAAAALFGIPLPLCSCGVIPTAMSMRREGASKAATVSFLISTPQTGVDSIAATASLLGGGFAVLRPVVALITALFGGMLTGATDKGDDKTAAESDGADVQMPSSFAGRCREALRYGFSEMIEDIGGHLLVGLLIAGAIAVFLPDGFFTTFADRPLINMLAVLAISIPMYICATGSVPIAAALMLKGLTPGAALVLLMAGPATNMAAIMVINKVLGRRTLLTYLAVIIGGAVGFGCVVDYLLPAGWFAVNEGSGVAACCHGESMPWWKWASAALLAVLIAAALLKRFNVKQSKTTDDMENVFKVKGMNCSHCKANVERAAKSVEGVTSAEADIAGGTLRVEGDAAAERIIEAVTAAGYECTK